MLNLQINKKDNLELDEKSTVTVNMSNPAFDSQLIARTYSYPQQLPLTQHNRVALEHQNRLDSRIRKDEQQADVFILDQLFDRGQAIIKEHTEQASKLTFKNDDIQKIESLSEVKIRDILGTIDITQTETVNIVLLADNDGPNWRLTINDVLYLEGGLGVDRVDALNDLAAAINVDYPGVASYDVPSDEFRISTTDPDFVISTFNDFTLISEQTFSDATEKNLQTYITTAVAGNEPIAFPVIFAREFYPRNFRWRNYINYRLDGDYIENGYDTEFGWATTYVPFVRLRYILDQIAATVGIDEIILDLPTAQADDLNSLLIYNNVTLDQLRLEVSLEFGEKEKNGFKTSINLADHVPDYTAEQLLQRIAGYFNLNLRFQRNKLYLRPNLRQISQPAKDFTNITDPAFIRTTTVGGGVLIEFEADTSTSWSPTHDSYTVGDGSNTLTLPAQPLHDRTIPNSVSNNEGWKMAAIEGQTGTSEPLDLETENQTLRLFFDRGQQVNEVGSTYWMGSTETTDYNDDPIGTISLDLGSATGIYPNFWRGWTQLLFSPTITRVTDLSIDQIISLKKWTDTKVYIYHPEGATLAIVETIQFKVTNKGITRAKVEYRKFEP